MADFGIGELLAAFGSAGGGAAAAGGGAAAAGAAAGGITAADVAAGAGILSAGVTAASVLGAKKPVMPPNPALSQAGQDQSQQDAQQNAMKRQSIAGGINSTIGTSGGQAGSMLNPGNMGGHSLLGE